MTHLPWMPVYVGDELAETSHLNAEEYGAYALLKMHLWQHGRLPCDDERLARIAKCAAERWAFVKDAIWTLFADDWRHPRLEALRAQSEETHKKRSEAGRRGGRPRLSEKPGYKPGFSQEKAGPKHPQPQPQPQSDSYSETEPQAQPHGSVPIPMKPPHCSEMIAPPDSGMISPPVSSGSAGSNCCQFVRVMCQALRGRFRRRLSPLSSMRWALWTRRSRMASA